MPDYVFRIADVVVPDEESMSLTFRRVLRRRTLHKLKLT